jgi:Sulfotransferase family
MTRGSPRVIFLGGLGRSGTTLLERLLGELPGVCTAGEVVHMWQRGIVADERCGCGDLFGSCPFWDKVGQAAFGGWAGVDVRRISELRAAVDRIRRVPALAAPVLQPATRREVDEYVAFYARVYAAIAEVSGCETVVDSSKHASLAFCLRWHPDLDLRVVHVVRDSRAVAFSWTRQVSRPDSATASYMTRYPPARAAALWNAHNSALHLLPRVGVATTRIRYEDLVAAPAATVAKVAEFAGLPSQLGELGYLHGDVDLRWAELSAAHTASGNPMRFATGQVPIRRDEQWRTAMPAGQRRMVTGLTLPLLARYGYAPRSAA